MEAGVAGKVFNYILATGSYILKIDLDIRWCIQHLVGTQWKV